MFRRYVSQALQSFAYFHLSSPLHSPAMSQACGVKHGAHLHIAEVRAE
jgi:hypothetical protein